jgi:hypothetical protein
MIEAIILIVTVLLGWLTFRQISWKEKVDKKLASLERQVLGKDEDAQPNVGTPTIKTAGSRHHVDDLYSTKPGQVIMVDEPLHYPRNTTDEERRQWRNCGECGHGSFSDRFPELRTCSLNGRGVEVPAYQICNAFWRRGKPRSQPQAEG